MWARLMGWVVTNQQETTRISIGSVPPEPAVSKEKQEDPNQTPVTLGLRWRFKWWWEK